MNKEKMQRGINRDISGEFARESEKIVFPEFMKSVDIEPLQCFYQVLSNDNYTSSGYSFYIKSPGENALLDPDIWIKYTFTLRDQANNALGNTINTWANSDAFANQYAASNLRLAFRSGNVVQRATQSMQVIINGHSITCEPWKYVDVLNKLYISDNQSRHEFSASGGKFDNGNHSHRVSGDIPIVGLSANINNATLGVNIIPGFHSNAEIVATGGGATGIAIMPAPRRDYFYNEGYDDRCMKLVDVLRRSQAPNANSGLQYGNAAAVQTYTIVLYERLPIYPFKMYSNDEIVGIIPNIRDLTIRGQFTSNLMGCMMRASADPAAITNLEVPALASGGSQCELYLKWYTPPVNVSIPPSVSLPLRKINVWAVSQPIETLVATDNPRIMTSVSQYNISLDGIPDLLLIYFKYRVDSLLVTYPDDYHFEITNLQINIEGASGKVSQIQTIDLYNKWKRYLHHEDTNLPSFDEWRRYNCVAVLKPEDYGVIKGPGMNNPVTLGVQFTPQNWWNIPKMGLVPAENYAGLAAELIVTTIFDKWSLTIKSSGSASSELTRVNSIVAPAPASIGLSELQPMGIRELM